MKIDSDNPNPITGATDGVNPSAPTGSSSARPAGQGSPADQLTVSPEAQLLQTAADAADATPDIRREVVERMRALLNDGAVGEDASRLADAIIDDVLKNK